MRLFSAKDGSVFWTYHMSEDKTRMHSVEGPSPALFKEPDLDPWTGSSETSGKIWYNQARMAIGPEGLVSMSCLRSVTDPAQGSRSSSYSNTTKSK